MFSVKIIDMNGSPIGENLSASIDAIHTYLEKGFRVINMLTNEEITKENICNVMGVSDGAVLM